MSAVPARYCWDWLFGGVVFRRLRCEEVPAGSLVVSGVVCEEILQQPRRCLAWELRLAEPVNKLAGSVPGAMAAGYVCRRGVNEDWSCTAAGGVVQDTIQARGVVQANGQSATASVEDNRRVGGNQSRRALAMRSATGMFTG